MGRNREYEDVLDAPIFETIARIAGKEYCEWHDGLAGELHTFINPDSGSQVERCGDCRPQGWVKQRETKD